MWPQHKTPFLIEFFSATGAWWLTIRTSVVLFCSISQSTAGIFCKIAKANETKAIEAMLWKKNCRKMQQGWLWGAAICPLWNRRRIKVRLSRKMSKYSETLTTLTQLLERPAGCNYLLKRNIPWSNRTVLMPPFLRNMLWILNWPSSKAREATFSCFLIRGFLTHLQGIHHNLLVFSCNWPYLSP